MATLRNKRKVAAVSRETPEGSRSSRGQNVLDPELTQDYISQVSEEIEGRVTKKLSKEFSKTESRILGALSKLDEFLLNPQVQTCSVAVPGTSRNCDSEYREPNGDRSLKYPCPEVGYSSHHSGRLNSSEVEECPHSCISVCKQIFYKNISKSDTQLSCILKAFTAALKKYSGFREGMNKKNSFSSFYHCCFTIDIVLITSLTLIFSASTEKLGKVRKDVVC